MNDMTSVITAKSDQINADDLVGGPIVVTIKSVRIRPGTEQPVEIALEGTDKLFRPSKTASRVMVAIWGPDASQYVGRSLHLFRDPDVTWAGVKVGGIRIDGASHIDSEKVIAVKESKKSSKLQRVKPLKVEQAQPPIDKAAAYVVGVIEAVSQIETLEALAEYEAGQAKVFAKLEKERPELRAEVRDAVTARFQELAPKDDAE